MWISQWAQNQVLVHALSVARRFCVYCHKKYTPELHLPGARKSSTGRSSGDLVDLDVCADGPTLGLKPLFTTLTPAGRTLRRAACSGRTSICANALIRYASHLSAGI